MSIPLLINGVVYTYPEDGDSGWGPSATNAFSALVSSTLQKTGGNFFLTADANFGATYGLIANYFTSRSANSSTTGALRLANTDSIGWRNNANSANIVLTVGADDLLDFNGIQLVDLSATQILTNKTLSTGTVFTGDIGAIDALSSTGIPVRTATDTWALRTLTAPAAGITITNPAGIAGNPTLVLANDLAALEVLTPSGIPVRTATDTWALRTLTGTTNQISISNGDGVAGNPTIALATDAVFPGTGSITVPVGTTAQRPSPANGDIRYNTTTSKFEAYENGGWINMVGASGAAPSNASYITLGTHGSLSDERVLTAGNGLTIIDGGPNSTVTLDTIQNISTVASPTFANITDSGLTASSFIYSNASKVFASTAAPTNGQLLIGSTGVNPVAATLTGTANQVAVINGAGSITLSTPQDIGTASNVLHNSLTLSALTAKSFIYSDGTKNLASTTSPTDGQILIGSTGNVPVLGTLIATVNQTTVAGGAGTITIGTVQNIGTGSSPTFAGATLSTLTANSFLYSGAGGALTTTAAPVNGELLIGSTGVAPVRATLTGTANQVVVTNAAGSITLSTPQDIGTASTPTFGGVTTGSLTFTGSSPIIQASTSDASDNSTLSIGGGGGIAVSRGGFTQLFGNEVSTTGGSVFLAAGNVSTGVIRFFTGNSVEAMRISELGNVYIGITANPFVTGRFLVANATSTAAHAAFYCNTNSFTGTMIVAQTETAPSTSWSHISCRSAGGTENFRVYGNGRVSIQNAGDIAAYTGTYGSWEMTGLRGNFAGISFTSADAPATLMVNNSATGIYRDNQASWLFYSTGFGGGGIFNINSIAAPLTDNSFNCGLPGQRWQNIYASNGAINTSDERLKTAVVNSDLGLNFINALRPVSYKWIEGSRISIEPDINDIDPVLGTPKPKSVAVPGTRTHYGLIAQEVKDVLEVQKNDDFGGWVLDDKSDPASTQSLRYMEFIAPLIKAIQELTARVKQLEEKK